MLHLQIHNRTYDPPDSMQWFPRLRGHRAPACVRSASTPSRSLSELWGLSVCLSICQVSNRAPAFDVPTHCLMANLYASLSTIPNLVCILHCSICASARSRFFFSICVVFFFAPLIPKRYRRGPYLQRRDVDLETKTPQNSV